MTQSNVPCVFFFKVAFIKVINFLMLFAVIIDSRTGSGLTACRISQVRQKHASLPGLRKLHNREITQLLRTWRTLYCQVGSINTKRGGWNTRWMAPFILQTDSTGTGWSKFKDSWFMLAPDSSTYVVFINSICTSICVNKTWSQGHLHNAMSCNQLVKKNKTLFVG